MVMSGCSVLQTIENSGEAFQSGASGMHNH
jgi:hypothetical protein